MAKQLIPEHVKDEMIRHPLTHQHHWVTARVKELALSWSKLECFEQCPRKFFAMHIAKVTPSDFSLPHLEFGKKIHSALEHRIMQGKPMRGDAKRFQPYADGLLKMTGNMALQTPIICEQNWAIDATGKGCDYFGDTVFFRGKADVCFGADGILYIYDWKTGQGKYPKPEQLELLALIAKGQPQLREYTKVSGSLIFIEANKKVTVNVGLNDQQHSNLMSTYLEKAIGIIDCYEHDDWAMNESPLCKFCPVKSCVYNGG